MNTPLLIGRDISWADAVGQAFRVRQFDRSSTTIGPTGKVRAASITQPYGYLLVESPILRQAAKLPIAHRDDYLLASSVFDEPACAHFISDAELLVTYAPKRRLFGALGLTHVLHYVIVPAGTLIRYYELTGDAHSSKRYLQLLFGELVYTGKLSVQVNQDLQL